MKLLLHMSYRTKQAVIVAVWFVRSGERCVVSPVTCCHPMTLWIWESEPWRPDCNLPSPNSPWVAVADKSAVMSGWSAMNLWKAWTCQEHKGTALRSKTDKLPFLQRPAVNIDNVIKYSIRYTILHFLTFTFSSPWALYFRYCMSCMYFWHQTYTEF